MASTSLMSLEDIIAIIIVFVAAYLNIADDVAEISYLRCCSEKRNLPSRRTFLVFLFLVSVTVLFVVFSIYYFSEPIKVFSIVDFEVHGWAAGCITLLLTAKFGFSSYKHYLICFQS